MNQIEDSLLEPCTNIIYIVDRTLAHFDFTSQPRRIDFQSTHRLTEHRSNVRVRSSSLQDNVDEFGQRIQINVGREKNTGVGRAHLRPVSLQREEIERVLIALTTMVDRFVKQSIAC